MSHAKILVVIHTYLIENLNIGGTQLLDHLLERGVLDEQEVQEVRAAGTMNNMNRTLLEFISRTSRAQFKAFVKALRESGHMHIAEIIDEGILL